MAHPFIPTPGLKHPAVQAARALNNPAGRNSRGRYLVEGEKMVQMALHSPSAVEAMFLADHLSPEQQTAWAQRIKDPAPPVYLAGRGILFKIMGTSYATAVEAVAVVASQEPPEEWWPGPQDVVVGAEAVEDPRNVGVLLRTADAAGARGLILDAACGDAYCRAAVRSSTGSILHLPLGRFPDLLVWLSEARAQGAQIVATSAHAATPFWDADLTGRCLILMGNETRGLSGTLRSQADMEVAIPRYGAAHSLNIAVAAGIVLYECARQRQGQPT